MSGVGGERGAVVENENNAQAFSFGVGEGIRASTRPFSVTV